MANYSLKALIDSETVKQFNKLKQKVVIVKTGEDSTNKLAWVTFSPFEINTVAWKENYGLYSSTNEIQGKVKITKASFTTAVDKQSYTFENGVFNSPTDDPALESNMYEITNNMTDYDALVFGLAQDVIANGVTFEGNPVNAITVLQNESATFIPHEKIIIYMESDTDDGMVISHIKSQVLELDFTTDENMTIKYDSKVGKFVKM
ncbi:hypothetical protein Ga0466249_000174 [Sporomusaceae bacterium BoRhaA]|uniref:hypothetical protein n=1 Tax=Pelorhabdus rhamnosifermentans TaxID=2772457 RepID=UPI001C06357D|nr:hypothetical protein [Pelorhabdus rhamnosifermentans]MBU2699095.1 hypothetical protein [Pelorhabdus rhamnosifermentans]